MGIKRRPGIRRGGPASGPWRITPSVETKIWRVLKQHVPENIAAGFLTHTEEMRHPIRMGVLNALKETNKMRPEEERLYRFYSSAMTKGNPPSLAELQKAGYTGDMIKNLSTLMMEKIHPALNEVARKYRGRRNVSSRKLNRARVLRKLHDGMAGEFEIYKMDLRELEGQKAS